MFLTRPPSPAEIEQFLEQSKDLPLSYDQIEIAKASPPGFTVDEARSVIGHGKATYELAKDALRNWRQFDLGWVELYPKGASIEPGTVVAVLARHVRLWSLNACRVVRLLAAEQNRFGLVYGTLPNHAETGEELFEVSFDARSGEVIYRIRAVSRPRAALARLGYPLTRILQQRFRRDSIAAMTRAVSI